MARALFVAVALVGGSLLMTRDGVRADAPDKFWRQEDPKFGTTQKYCQYTGNAMILSAARKAFNAIDGHFGGILNPTQFSENCSGWTYWVDENSGDCGGSPPAPACASIWNYYTDNLHTHGNGGHIG